MYGKIYPLETCTNIICSNKFYELQWNSTSKMYELKPIRNMTKNNTHKLEIKIY
jgi:hypothetical protein